MNETPYEARGEFTADRLFRHGPDIYRAIVAMIGDGKGVRYTARVLGVSHNTIRAVVQQERMATETL